MNLNIADILFSFMKFVIHSTHTEYQFIFHFYFQNLIYLNRMTMAIIIFT